MREKIDTIICKITSKEISECNAIDELFELFEKEIKVITNKHNEKILDINLYATLLIHNRSKIRERVLWSIIANIANRTTD